MNFFFLCGVQLRWLQDHYVSMLHRSFKNVIRLAIKFGAGLTQFIYRWEGLELEADHLPQHNT